MKNAMYTEVTNANDCISKEIQKVKLNLVYGIYQNETDLHNLEYPWWPHSASLLVSKENKLMSWRVLF